MRKPGNNDPRLVAPKRNYAPAKPAKRPKPARKRASTGKRRRTAPRNPLVRLLSWLVLMVLRVVWWIGVRATGIAVLVLAGSTIYYYTTLPPAIEQVDGRTRGSVTMLDDKGKIFAWRGEQFGSVIRAKTVSPYLKDAVVATEDKRFYHHFGISPRGIASAIRINLRDGRGPLTGNGGSTITQQVAKMLCLGRKYDAKSGQTEKQFVASCRRSTLFRKLKEVPYAFAMELKYTKNQILTIYLNRAYLGAGTQGFEAASERYFSIPASKVNPAEAAMLAGLLTAPSRLAPTNNLKRSQKRADVVVGLMLNQGYLTKAQAAEARAKPATLSKAAAAQIGGYFADWVDESIPKVLTKSTTDDILIKTTFDARIQAAAESAVKNVFETKVTPGSKAQVAIVVMSPDGAVRAMIGGRGSGQGGLFNRATQAHRQTGSSFKPFVYAAALDLGYRFDSIVDDAPLTINVPGSGPWSPKNYSRTFEGPVTLTRALAHSLNTAAVRISEAVGRDSVRTVARDFGIGSKLDAGPALALGTSGATLLEMTGAYAGILNGGRSVAPYGLVQLSLQGDKTPFMDKSAGMGERVISEHAARQLVYMMYQVAEVGTARRARLPDREIAAKTGTTQGARDAWFIGFTANYVVGVWMGNDDNSKLVGVTGGGLPAEIWKETLLGIDVGVPPKPLPMIDPTKEGPPPPTVKPARTVRRNPAQNILQEVLSAIFGKRNQ